MLVHTILHDTAAEFPDRVAVIYKDQKYTYSELSLNAHKVANFLKEKGVRRGDKVVLLLENSPEYIACYFGILGAGGVAVPLHANTSPDQMGYLLEHSDARAVIASAKFATTLDGLRDQMTVPLLTSVVQGGSPGAGWYPLERILTEGSGQDPEVRVIDIDLESIVYTSGSTGLPKGVMLSHLNTVSNMRSIAEYFHLTAEDRVMVVLPFAYIFGKSLLLTHFLVGGSVIINNNFIFPNKVLDEMVRYSASGFAGVPSTYSILLNRSKLRDMKIPSLRYMCQAGGAMAPAVQQQIIEMISPAELYIMYGATEAAPRLTYLEPDMLPGKLGSIGKAVPNVDVFVADEDGSPVPPGTEGEIVGRGSNIMVGYWKDPERTAEVLKNGLYFTGDLGKEDEEGFLYVTGRKRDFIKVKGFRISAKEIEEVILEDERVHEAAVIGIPDEVMGEAVKACIVLRKNDGLTEEEVKSFLSGKLPPLKIPKHIEFFDALPKNDSGKILKPELLALESKKRLSRT